MQVTTGRHRMFPASNVNYEPESRVLPAVRGVARSPCSVAPPGGTARCRSRRSTVARLRGGPRTSSAYCLRRATSDGSASTLHSGAAAFSVAAVRTGSSQSRSSSVRSSGWAAGLAAGLASGGDVAPLSAADHKRDDRISCFSCFTEKNASIIISQFSWCDV